IVITDLVTGLSLFRTMNDSCNFTRVNDLVNSIQLVVYIPTFILGVTLNSLAIWVFCCFLKKWSESTIYMTNLAMADLLLLISLPFKMHFSKHPWILSKYLCSFVESLYFVNMYGSIFLITVISLDRYIAIRHPFKAKELRSKKVAICFCIGIWIFVWLGSIPVYSFHDHSPNFRCFHGISKSSWNVVLILLVEVFGFLIPTTVVVYCSIKSIQTLLDSSLTENIKEKRKTCIRIIVANLTVFIISFTPNHLGIFLQFLVRNHIITDCVSKQNISLFVQLAMCFANVNCCLDALCYYFVTEEFRESTDRVTERTFSFILSNA
uniref:G protein-coupled receptor 55 n=1 Tax=Latimeria chalumnae TaxID=7897 RepID=H3A3A4_LATCH